MKRRIHSSPAGVISLPNNTNQWGPWAGKILTGDEHYGILNTIDTNGAVTPYDFGIIPDDFVLIPTNEDLYVCDYGNSHVVKLSRDFLTNYVGGLLITDEANYDPPKLCIVNWSGTNFVARAIDTAGFINEPEDAAFAPLNLPSQPIQ